MHNVFTKHFNLALTAALGILMEDGAIRHPIAWCHDFSWTSPSSRTRVHPGYPWDLLRTAHPGITYVTVSARRQGALADLFGCPAEQIHLIYNGVDPATLLGLSPAGLDLAERLDLFGADLILLMPVRVARAKNIEFALQVLAALKQSLHPKLIVTGPPDPHDPESMAYYHSLQELRRSLGVRMMPASSSNRAQMHPSHISSMTAVGDLFRMANVMFMPSHREGFGMPVLEAGAGVHGLCGYPCRRRDTATRMSPSFRGENLLEPRCHRRSTDWWRVCRLTLPPACPPGLYLGRAVPAPDRALLTGQHANHDPQRR